MKAWKWVGLAGIAGVAAVGVVAVRKRRAWDEADSDHIKAQLHERLEKTDMQTKVGESDTRDGGE